MDEDKKTLIRLALNYANALIELEADFRFGELKDYEFAMGVVEIASKLRQAAQGL